MQLKKIEKDAKGRVVSETFVDVTESNSVPYHKIYMISKTLFIPEMNLNMDHVGKDITTRWELVKH